MDGYGVRVVARDIPAERISLSRAEGPGGPVEAAGFAVFFSKRFAKGSKEAHGAGIFEKIALYF